MAYLHVGKALLDNFIFASLKEEEIMTLINAMEFVNATSGENLITQGILCNLCSCVLNFVIIMHREFF